MMALGLVMLIWSLGAVHRVARADTAWVHLEPAYIQINAGETIDIEVIIQDIEDLYGVDIRIRFDPELLEMVDATPGDGIVMAVAGEFPFPDFQVKNQGSNRDGTIWYAATQLSPREAASGTGTVMTMQFKGLAAGISAIELYEVDLVDSGGIGIPKETSDGEVVIVGELTPTVTFTRQPTRTKTPTPIHTLPGSTSASATPTPLPAEPATQVPGGYPPQPGATMAPTHTRAPTPVVTRDQPSAAVTNTPSGRPGYPSGGPPTIPPPATPAVSAPTPAESYPSEPTQVPGAGATARLVTPTPAIPQPSPVVPQGGTKAPTLSAATPGAVVPERQAPSAATQPPPTVSHWMMRVVPTAVPPATIPAEREEPEPLLPPEIFGCFVVVLLLFTMILALYLVRRERIGPPTRH